MRSGVTVNPRASQFMNDEQRVVLRVLNQQQSQWRHLRKPPSHNVGPSQRGSLFGKPTASCGHMQDLSWNLTVCWG